MSHSLMVLNWRDTISSKSIELITSLDLDSIFTVSWRIFVSEAAWNSGASRATEGATLQTLTWPFLVGLLIFAWHSVEQKKANSGSQVN